MRAGRAGGWVRAATALAVAAAAACGGAGADAGEEKGSGSTAYVDPEPLVLGFLPSQRATEVVPDAERMAGFLSERLGRRVEVMVPTTYEPLIEGFRFGHVHAAFLDGGPGWIAHRRTGAEVVLAEVKDGATHYWAEAFVREDSPLRTLDDVVGRRVAFTSRTGSSGFLMPIGSLIADGRIEVSGDELSDLEDALRRSFEATIDAGGYRQALEALLQGRVDVAFGAHDAPDRFLDEADRARVRPLHRFGRIPSHAVLVAGNLDPALVERFRAAMLELNDPANLPLLSAIYGVDGLVAVGTEEHLGEFGRALSALPGMERTLVTRANR